MPTSRNFIALDLEFNQPSGKIIQVGVAIGSPSEPETAILVKDWFLYPNESVAPEIANLTGITDELLQRKSVGLREVAQDLGALLQQKETFVNPVTWGGGDSAILLKVFADAGIPFPYFGRRWIDVKTQHTLIRLAQGRAPSGGLASAMSCYKLAFKGQAHRADVDAYNTLRLFFHLLRRQSALEAMLSTAKAL